MSVLTISRQFGAGGRTLAQQVADKLGYNVVHEEIIEKLADRAKMSADSIRSFEEEEKGLIKNAAKFLSPKKFIDHVLDTKRNYMDGQLYVSLLQRILPEIAEQDNIIIIGRGGQVILKNRPDTFHVLLIADKNDRIKFMQENYNISYDQAKRSVHRRAKQRENLMKLLKLGDYDQPIHYDIVLNMSKMSVPAAVETLCHLVSQG
jgi:cytidylate kinase